MTNNSKKISFIFAGLLIVFGFLLFTQSNYVEASEKNGKKFGDWVISCTEQNNSDKKTQNQELCFVTQQINSTDKDKKSITLALYQIGYVVNNKGEKKLTLISFLSFLDDQVNSILLTPGTSMIASKNLIIAGKFSNCMKTGCQSIAEISDTDLNLLLKSDKPVFSFMTPKGQTNYPFSTKGLSEGLELLKK